MPSQLMQRYFEFVSQRPGHILAPLLLIVLVAVIYLVVQGARRKRQRDYEEDLARGIPAEPPARPFPWVRGFIAAVAMAAFYLVIFRVISLMPPFYRDQKGGAILMSFSFLFLGPFVAGVITVAQATRKDPWPVSAWVLAPWIPVLANMLLALAVAWEGIICVVFIVPPAMISASLAVAPSLRVTNALGRSPQTSCGIATTAQSSTAGCALIACSTSIEEMFSPPEMITSFPRSRSSIAPSGCRTPRSPE